MLDLREGKPCSESAISDNYRRTFHICTHTYSLYYICTYVRYLQQITTYVSTVSYVADNYHFRWLL